LRTCRDAQSFIALRFERLERFDRLFFHSRPRLLCLPFILLPLSQVAALAAVFPITNTNTGVPRKLPCLKPARSRNIRWQFTVRVEWSESRGDNVSA
jgi:hypothetical protein